MTGRPVATPADRAITEHAFQSWVVEVARYHGWLVHYTPDWMYRLVVNDMRRKRVGRDWPDPGFPDLWLVHPDSGRLLVLECKSESGSVRPVQKAWLSALSGAGIDARLVRPRHRDEIERILSDPTQS